MVKEGNSPKTRGKSRWKRYCYHQHRAKQANLQAGNYDVNSSVQHSLPSCNTSHATFVNYCRCTNFGQTVYSLITPSVQVCKLM